MEDIKLTRALPREVPNYHQRQAAHFRALAETATTPAVSPPATAAAVIYAEGRTHSTSTLSTINRCRFDTPS